MNWFQMKQRWGKSTRSALSPMEAEFYDFLHSREDEAADINVSFLETEEALNRPTTPEDVMSNAVDDISDALKEINMTDPSELERLAGSLLAYAEIIHQLDEQHVEYCDICGEEWVRHPRGHRPKAIEGWFDMDGKTWRCSKCTSGEDIDEDLDTLLEFKRQAWLQCLNAERNIVPSVLSSQPEKDAWREFYRAEENYFLMAARYARKLKEGVDTQ